MPPKRKKREKKEDRSDEDEDGLSDFEDDGRSMSGSNSYKKWRKRQRVWRAAARQ